MRKVILLLAMLFVIGGDTVAFGQHSRPCVAPEDGQTKIAYFPLPSRVVEAAHSGSSTDRDHALQFCINAFDLSTGWTDWLSHELISDNSTAISSLAETFGQGIQNGSSSLSSAATSVVSKAMSSVLGLALESGAVSSTSTGTTSTITMNVQQLVKVLDTIDKPCSILSTQCSMGDDIARGLSIAVSLNPAPQSNGLSDLENSVLSGLSGVQNPVFNNLSIQKSMHGRKDPAKVSKEFQTVLDKVDPKLAKVVTDASGDLANAVRTQPAYREGRRKCQASVKAAAQEEDEKQATQAVEDAEKACELNIFNVLKNTPDIQAKLKAFFDASAAYMEARDAAYKAAFFTNTYSFEYDLTHNAAQPFFSTFKGIYGYGTPTLQITANGSATIYNSLEGSSESRLRSAQAASQVDYTPSWNSKLQAAFSGGYYFQYMVANGLLDLPSISLAPGTSIPLPSGASTLLNTTGPIHIEQGKVTLSIKGTHFKIPLAVTRASRTDLIKADRVSGNFGISYDFGSLFSK